jgi:hypothetical protein
MAVTAFLYTQFFKSLANKEFDFDSDTIKCMLVTSAYTVDRNNHQYKDVSITNEISGTGYTAGGTTLAAKTVTLDAAGFAFKFDNTVDPNWPGATFTARKAIFYDDTPGSNKPLIGYIDFGQDESVAGATFTIQLSVDGLFRLAGV